MADWVDTLSDDEVKALYKFKQGGVDSLSGDEVKLLYPHKDKITQTVQRHQAADQTMDILKTVGGAAEAGMSAVAGLPSQIVGGLAGVGKLMTGGSIDEAANALSDIQKWNFGAGAYQPYSDKGKEYSEKLGHALEYPVKKAGDVGEYLGGDIGRLTGEVGMGTVMALVDPLIGIKGAKSLINRAGKDTGKAPSRIDAILEQSKPAEVADVPVKPIERGYRPTAEEQATQEALNRQSQYEQPQLKVQDEITQLRTQMAELARKGDYAGVDEIRYGRLSELEKQLGKDESQPAIPEHPGQLELPLTDNPVEGMAKRNIDKLADTEGQLNLFEHKQPDVLDTKAADVEKAYAERPQTDEMIQQRWNEEHAQQDEQQRLLDLEDKLRVEPEQGTGQGPKTREAQRMARQGQRGAIRLSWGDKEKAPLLRKVTGLEDIGHARIESPEQAIELAKNASDIDQNMLQRGINALTKGGTYLKSKLNNPVIHFTADKFLDADGMARAEVSQKVHGEYLSKLREVPKKEFNEVAELLNRADLEQVTIKPEVLQQAGLSPQAIDFITTHQRIMDDVFNQLNAVREAAGKKPITKREAYSAMSMTGDFRAVAEKYVRDEQGNITLDANGNPKKEVVGVVSSNIKKRTKQSLERLKQSMLEKDPELIFTDSPVRRQVSTRGTPHEAFTDALAVLGEDNPHFAEFLQTLKEVAKDSPNNFMGMQKHMMQKKGVWGMEGRKPWLSADENAKAFFENQVKYAENAYTWKHLAEAAAEVNKVLRDPEVLGKQAKAVEMADHYMQNALGINPNKVGQWVDAGIDIISREMGIGKSIPRTIINTTKKIVNTSLLSLNPMFLAINLIQPIASMPGLAAMAKSRGVATTMTFGLDALAKGGITYMKEAAGMKLNPLEQGAMEYARKHHIYASDMVEHANQVQKGAAYYATKITQSPAAVVETATRAQMYMGLVHMLSDGGLTPKNGLYEQAARMTDKGMNNYSAMEKPTMYNALGELGSMAYNLKSYGHNEISRWAEYARELSKNGNAKPLLTQMATTMLLAGTMGLPFFSMWESVYDEITAMLGSPRSLALDVMSASQKAGQVLGDNGKYFLSHGAGVLLGADFHKRTGLGDVLPNNAADAAFAGAGKLGSVVKAAAHAVTNPGEQTGKELAYNLAPSSAQGLLDTQWYQEGDLAYSKDASKPIKTTARRSDTDTLLRKIGLTGINESVQKESNYRQQQLDQVYAGYRTKAMNNLMYSLVHKNAMDQKDINNYFSKGQGDPQTFDNDLVKAATALNLSPEETKMLSLAAAKRIPQLRSLERRF